MFVRIIPLCLALGFASAAQGDLVLDIVLDASSNPANPPGVYDPNEVVGFSVLAAQDTGADMSIRLMTINFSDSSPELTFIGDNYYVWDFAGAGVTPGLTTPFNAAPNFNITYQSGAPVPGFMFVIPSGSPLQLGFGEVTVPGAAATYQLDVLNATESNPNFTARIDFDFANPTTWTAFDGTITGGVARMTVVPEPVSLALLAIGGVAVLRRRRA